MLNGSVAWPARDNVGLRRTTMRLEDAECRAEIEELLHRYARLLDQERFSEWPDLFTSDGIYSAITYENFKSQGLLLFKDEGREAMKERAAFVMGYFQSQRCKTLHTVSNITLAAPSDEETNCNSYFVIYRSPWNRLPELQACGEYHDRLVKTGGQWKFRERLVIVDNGTLPQNFSDLL
jgi:3-phenylpropionate/cinnamic acid dioxygenase small subunit